MAAKKILIIEDDIFIRDIYQMKFTQVGFDVAVAEDGIIALKKLEEQIPDIILLDIMMPGMNGMEVLKIMKNNEKWKKIRVIMLTNLSEKGDIMEKSEYGA